MLLRLATSLRASRKPTGWSVSVSWTPILPAQSFLSLVTKLCRTPQKLRMVLIPSRVSGQILSPSILCTVGQKTRRAMPHSHCLYRLMVWVLNFNKTKYKVLLIIIEIQSRNTACLFILYRHQFNYLHCRWSRRAPGATFNSSWSFSKMVSWHVYLILNIFVLPYLKELSVT